LTSKVLYKSSVSRDFKKIAPRDVERMLLQIRNDLCDSPRAGEPLHGEFGGLFKYRVGDYRVIYALSGKDVLVLRVSHRGKAYG
jgi:mRNA interferase RelE/StbE